MFGLSNNDKLKKELEECRESVSRIEHAFKMLQLEWTETYDKFRQLNWRVAKRLHTLEAAEQSSPQGEETAQGGGEIASGFSPAQREAMRAINARRAKRSTNGGE